jgi:PIN domain nuclease of toxin-antitoxin system
MSEEAPLLLDTCAAIWISHEQRIAEEASNAIQRAQAVAEFIYVSPITAWEIGLLISGGKVSSPMSPQRWFQRLMQAPGLRLADMPPEVLIGSSFLPGKPPRDPADRILAATAREYSYTLVTRDGPLLDYAAQGHIKALAC